MWKMAYAKSTHWDEGPTEGTVPLSLAICILRVLMQTNKYRHKKKTYFSTKKYIF